MKRITTERIEQALSKLNNFKLTKAETATKTSGCAIIAILRVEAPELKGSKGTITNKSALDKLDISVEYAWGFIEGFDNEFYLGRDTILSSSIRANRHPLTGDLDWVLGFEDGTVANKRFFP